MGKIMTRSFFMFEVFHRVPYLILDTSQKDSTILAEDVLAHPLVIPGMPA